MGQRGRGGQPVESWHLDVQQRDVRVVRARGRDDFVAPADLGHDRELLVQLQQSGEGRSDEALVVGQQQTNHRPAAIMLV